MRKTTSAPTTSSTDRNGDSFVNRWFSVEGLRNGLHPPTVNHAFTQQSGVRSVYIDIEHDRIRINYDNTIINVETVIEILRNAGCPSRQRFWDREPPRISWRLVGVSHAAIADSVSC